MVFTIAVLVTVHDLACTVDKSQQIDLDFSKDFDKVPYQHLAAKLDYCGIHGNTNQWILSFLSDCQQHMVINGNISAEKSIIRCSTGECHGTCAIHNLRQ